MNSILRFFAIAGVFLADAAVAQSLNASRLGETIYPGAIYISPQDSGFIAPGIYRSVSNQSRVTSPIEVSRVCSADFRENANLKKLASVESEAAGLTDVVHKDFGAKLVGLNLKSLKLGADLEVKDSSSITATPLRVLSSDDDVAAQVLANIGNGCKKLIAGHIQRKRVVFIAAQAIQAKNFELAMEFGPKAGASFSCSIPILCGSDTGLSANINRQRQKKRSSVQHVTFAIVPAEIDFSRFEIRGADLR